MRGLFLGAVAFVWSHAGCLPPASTAPPPQTAYAAPEDESPKTAPIVQPNTEDADYSRSVQRFERECAQSNANSCSLLGHALRAYDPMVRGSHVDLPTSLRAYIRGCKLGDFGDCYSAGDAIYKGEGAEKDPTRASEYLRRSCSASALHNMQGFACSELGEALLAESGQFSANYDEAIGAFDKACAYQPVTCAMRDFYKGTGLVSSTSAPTGAVGFDFGIDRKRATAICRGSGGSVRSTGASEVWCDKYRIDALDETARYVHLTFCSGDLCGILVALHPQQDRYMTRYMELRHKLHEGYGPEGRITRQLPAECRTDAELPSCVETNRAAFNAYWQFKAGEALTIQLSAVEQDVNVLLGYQSAAGTKAIKFWGL